jgi:hypothetical protein
MKVKGKSAQWLEKRRPVHITFVLLGSVITAVLLASCSASSHSMKASRTSPAASARPSATSSPTPASPKFADNFGGNGGSWNGTLTCPDASAIDKIANVTDLVATNYPPAQCNYDGQTVNIYVGPWFRDPTGSIDSPDNRQIPLYPAPTAAPSLGQGAWVTALDGKGVILVPAVTTGDRAGLKMLAASAESSTDSAGIALAIRALEACSKQG